MSNEERRIVDALTDLGFPAPEQGENKETAFAKIANCLEHFARKYNETV